MDWATVATLGPVGVAAVAGMWRLGRQIGQWRDEDARTVGKLAWLWAGWMDEAEDRDRHQDRELADIKNRVHATEKALGLEVPPPGPPVRTRKSVRHRTEVAEAFPEDFLDDG